MEVLVCIKRVPGSSASVILTEDGQGVDTRHVGWTVGPHEECAVEAAVALVEAHGGSARVLTVGPEAALEQLREALAVGVGSAVHVRADNDRWGPADVAGAIADVVRAHGTTGEGYDLVLVGNDAADTGDFQVGVRIAYRLGWPVVTGVRTVELLPAAADGAADPSGAGGSGAGERVLVSGDGPDGTEWFELPLPAVLAIKEGGISPRYPSIPGRLRAKKAPVEVIEPERTPVGTGRVRLMLPPEQPSQVQILGTGPDAAPAVVDLLQQLGVVAR